MCALEGNRRYGSRHTYYLPTTTRCNIKVLDLCSIAPASINGPKPISVSGR